MMDRYALRHALLLLLASWAVVACTSRELLATGQGGFEAASFNWANAFAG